MGYKIDPKFRISGLCNKRLQGHRQQLTTSSSSQAQASKAGQPSASPPSPKCGLQAGPAFLEAMAQGGGWEVEGESPLLTRLLNCGLKNNH